MPTPKRRARPVKPATPEQEQNLRYCETYLKVARDLAVSAGCPELALKIRSAIASAGGAMRHMQRRLTR